MIVVKGQNVISINGFSVNHCRKFRIAVELIETVKYIEALNEFQKKISTVMIGDCHHKMTSCSATLSREQLADLQDAMTFVRENVHLSRYALKMRDFHLLCAYMPFN